MNPYEGCQLPSLPTMGEGQIIYEDQPWSMRIKRWLAFPWNRIVKKWMKYFYKKLKKFRNRNNNVIPSTSVNQTEIPVIELQAGDNVRVRSLEEIRATLDYFKESKGCAFLPYMAEFCGTTQTVLQPVNRFLDESDYKVRKAKGIVLLKGVVCSGTPVFGRCDRACHMFWRVEWLEKIEG